MAPAMMRKIPTARSAVRFSPTRGMNREAHQSDARPMGLFASAEGQDLVDELRVGEDHATAAVAF
jgi:hypothetical protein